MKYIVISCIVVMFVVLGKLEFSSIISSDRAREATRTEEQQFAQTVAARIAASQAGSQLSLTGAGAAAGKLGTAVEAIAGNAMGGALSWGASVLRTPALLQRVPILGRILGSGQWTSSLAQMGKTLEGRIGGYEATKRLTEGMGTVGSLLSGALWVNNAGYIGIPLTVAGYRYAMTPDDFITALNKGEPVGEAGAKYLEDKANGGFSGLTEENQKAHEEAEGALYQSDPVLMRMLGGKAR